jgi:hypothetical protein
MRPKCCAIESPAKTAGPRTATSGWLLLAVGASLILAIWLIVLPRLAADPAVQRRIQFLQQRQIDPSAMFYTELETMAGIRQRMAEIRRQHAGAFWVPAGASAWESNGAAGEPSASCESNGLQSVWAE